MVIRESKKLSLFEYEEDALEDESGMQGAPDTPKDRIGLRKSKEYSNKENYHLQDQIVSEELVKHKEKKMMEYEKKERREWPL